MSGGPYGPEGVLSDFEGGVPKVYNRTDPSIITITNVLLSLLAVPFFTRSEVIPLYNWRKNSGSLFVQNICNNRNIVNIVRIVKIVNIGNIGNLGNIGNIVDIGNIVNIDIVGNIVNIGNIVLIGNIVNTM